MSDLIFFNTLFKFETWSPLLFIKFFLLTLLIGIITCLCDGPFVIILICGLDLGLLFLLMICWILSILIVLRKEKASLIFSTFLVLLIFLANWIYDLAWLGAVLMDLLDLKYFEILLTSLGDLAGIRGSSLSMLTDLLMEVFYFLLFLSRLTWGVNLYVYYMQVHLSGNYISMMISSLNYTSLPFMAATFLITHLLAVLQLSRYSVFYGRDTPIWLGLPWRSYSYLCLNTETFAQGNRNFTIETPSIFYNICLYIRLVVTL